MRHLLSTPRRLAVGCALLLTIPPVDELHLHHAVWLKGGYPAFAAGEEKTITQFPRG